MIRVKENLGRDSQTQTDFNMWWVEDGFAEIKPPIPLHIYSFPGHCRCMVGWKPLHHLAPASCSKYTRDFYSPIDTCVGAYPASDTERIRYLSRSVTFDEEMHQTSLA